MLYLLKLDKKLCGRAQYYLGWTANERTLERRLAHHRNGTGARFMAAAREAGIDFQLVGVIPGDRTLERRYKRWKKHSQLVSKFQKGDLKCTTDFSSL